MLGFQPGGHRGGPNPDSLYRGQSMGFGSDHSQWNPWSLYSSSDRPMWFRPDGPADHGWNPYSQYSPGSWGRQAMGFSAPGLNR